VSAPTLLQAVQVIAAVPKASIRTRSTPGKESSWRTVKFSYVIVGLALAM
jgi:hypothetical protein